MNDYETARATQIAANRALIASLGLSKPKPTVKRSASTESSEDAETTTRKRKKRATASARAPKVPLEPTRRSSRLIEAPARTSKDNGHMSLPDDFSDSELSYARRSARAAMQIRQLPKVEIPEEDPDGPEMDYDPDFRAPLPTRDAADQNSGYGRLRFSDTPHFTPNLTPEDVMRLGSFGGTYWRPFYSSVCRKEMDADFDELPGEWYEGLDTERYLSSLDYDPDLNQYGVKASQSIEDWEKAGWIRRQDPRGWMQWYCRFYLGRRTPDDDRQIRRFLSAVGPRGRFKTSLVKKIANGGGVEEWDNYEIAPILRQTLQHWAVRITREDVLEYLT